MGKKGAVRTLASEDGSATRTVADLVSLTLVNNDNKQLCRQNPVPMTLVT